MLSNPFATTSSLIQGKHFSYASSVHNLQMMSTTTHVDWILDSGVTDHIICQVSLLINHIHLQANLYFPDDTIFPITHYGSLHLLSLCIKSSVFQVLNAILFIFQN